MADTHPSNIRYFLGIGVPSPENAFFTELKELYHPENRVTSPPHITLKPPFLMPNKSYLLEKLAKIARYQEPFDIVLENIGSFRQPKYATVFLEPKSGEKLKALESLLGKEIHYLPKTRNFHPHLTLAQKVPHENLASVKNELRDLNLKLKLRVDALILYRQDESGQWEVDQEFRFGQSNQHPAHAERTRRKHQTWSNDGDPPENH
jgi:2'-5' RNA ligase